MIWKKNGKTGAEYWKVIKTPKGTTTGRASRIGSGRVAFGLATFLWVFIK